MQGDEKFFSANYVVKFQPQFKPLNQGLQSATKMGLQSVLGGWITKCGNNGLQSALGITKCGRVDYKLRQGLRSKAELQSELVHLYLDFWISGNVYDSPCCLSVIFFLSHITFRCLKWTLKNNYLLNTLSTNEYSPLKPDSQIDLKSMHNKS